MQILKKIIKITDLAVFDLSLPIIQFGSGVPKVLIINNMHGDELSGFYILEKLLNILPDKIIGEVSIITSANPLGLIQKQRLAPFETIDLNRGYPNPPKARGVSAAIKSKLLKFSLMHDFIIDIHAFAKPCLAAVLALPQANDANQSLLHKCSTVAGTEIIIAMDFNAEEKRVASALGAHLIQQGKFFLAFEYPPLHCLNEEKIIRYADGFKNMLTVLGVASSSELVSPKHQPSVFERQQILSEHSALFIPEVKLGAIIKFGERLGQMIDIKSLIRMSIFSPYEGVVIEIAGRGFFLFGEKLATIGKHK